MCVFEVCLHVCAYPSIFIRVTRHVITQLAHTLTCDSPMASGIPALVLFDGQTGELISTNGRQIIQTDPTDEGFPSGINLIVHDKPKLGPGRVISAVRVISAWPRFIFLSFSASFTDALLSHFFSFF